MEDASLISISSAYSGVAAMEDNQPVNGTSGDSPPKKKEGLLSQDHEELCERISYLEKKVQQQEDEIVCLKSAVSDVIRRLSQSESGRAQNSVLPSKPTFHSPRKSTSSATSRKSHINPLENATMVPHRSNTPPVSHRSARNSTSSMKKLSSSTTEIASASSASVRRSLSQTNLMSRSTSRGAKEPQWNQEEGYLKMYLRGRAVNLYAPSSISNFDPSASQDPPETKLKMQWVYGYRGRDCRSNLYMLPTGEMVYFTAAVVVLHNIEENTQRHYLGHTDDVKCLAIHPDQKKVASGQVAGHSRSDAKRKPGKKEIPLEDRDNWPHIRVWDSVTLNTIHVIGIGDFDRAVCCISFSKLDGGNHLCAVDDANEHVISIWGDINKDKVHKITETKSSTEPVLSAEYHPGEKNSIVTCGKNQITFWTVENGSLARKQGIFDKHEKPKYVLCLAFNENGDVLSGDSNGNILVWKKGTNKISQAINDAHSGGVFSLCVMKDGTLLSGGGKDRRIVLWDNEYKPTSVKQELEEISGGVRMISQGNGGMVLVGTTKNSIFQGSVDLELSVVVQGHLDELWGLCPHPSQQQFLTCGDDKRLYMWDSLNRSVVWSLEISDPAHSCDIYPDGSVAAIGTETGRWMVIELDTRSIVNTHTDGNEQIETVKYSPDGNFLALGSRDNSIYVYEVTDNGKKYSKVGKCTGHSSFITHIDWDVDSKMLMSNSGDYEVLFWNIPKCKQNTQAADLRDVQWATQNCTLSFNSAGIWPEGADGTDVNGCAVNGSRSLIASGDDYGKVNLYSYPCSQPKAKGNHFGGHSSHVTSVAFLCDDSRLISTGGRDNTVLQWEFI